MEEVLTIKNTHCPLANSIIEEVASTGPGIRLFQLYVFKDRNLVTRLVRRAERAGYKAIVLTANTPRLGRRDADIKNRFTMPPSFTLKNFENLDLGKIDETNDSGLASYVAGLFARSLNWKEGSVICFSVLKAPGMDVLKISMSPPQEIADGVSIWEWSGAALDEGADASKWFSDYLGKPSRLVRFNAASETRPVKPSFWSHKPVEPEYDGGKQIMFSDLFPYLMASQASLDTLNEHLKDPVPINRFRPNILVDGCEPFSEDLWTYVRINNFTFQCCMLCFRCQVNEASNYTQSSISPNIRRSSAACHGIVMSSYSCQSEA